MLSLSCAQIEIIASNVCKAGITLPHLQDELIDHLCCQVEELMRKGMDFEQAYDSIKHTIGVRELKKVQEDTILLIDKKYTIMKTTMNVFGILSLGLIAIGTIFKLIHWNNGTFFFLIGFPLLAGVFFPLLIWVMKKESKIKGNLLLYISAGIGGMALILGIFSKILQTPFTEFLLITGYLLLGIIFPILLLTNLLKKTTEKRKKITYIIGCFSIVLCISGDFCKFFHFPGALIMLLFGFFFLTAIFFPMYVFHNYKADTHIKPNFVFLSIGLCFFSLFTILLAISTSKDEIADFITINTGINSNKVFIENRNKELYKNLAKIEINSDSIDKATIQSFRINTTELKNYIHQLKIDMIVMCDEITKTEAEKVIENPILFKEKGDRKKYFELFFPNKSIVSSSELKKKIRSYKKQLLSYSFTSERSKTVINKALNTRGTIIYNSSENPKSWEIAHFCQIPAIEVLNYLTQLEIWVQISEAEIIKDLFNHNSQYKSIAVLSNSKKLIVKH
jgi:hypothetical protein